MAMMAVVSVMTAVGMTSVVTATAVVGVMAMMGVVGVMRASRRDPYPQAEGRERGRRKGLGARRPRCEHARQGHGSDCPATS